MKTITTLKTVGLAAAFTMISGVPALAEMIELKPVADTYVKGEDPGTVYGNEIEMRVRSFDDGSIVRYQVAYLKFDLSFLADIKPGAELEILTQGTSLLWDAPQIGVYLLTDAAGNTPQDWDPTTLTYDTTGAEFTKPYANNVDPFNSGQLTYLGDLVPPAEAGGGAILSGAALDDLIAAEYAGDMEFTLVVVPQYLSNRATEFDSAEGGPLSPVLRVPSDTTVLNQSVVPVDADTWMRIERTIGEPIDTFLESSVYGDSDTLRIRSLDDTVAGGAVREYPTYVRFDLSGIQEDILPGAEFLIIADGNIGWSETQVKLYGLVPGDGHTPQNWDEMTLSPDTLGSEIDKSLLGDGYEGADETRITGPYLMQADKSANLVLGSGIIPIYFSGNAMDAFIAERMADDGLVTFVIMNRPDSNRDINFYSKEFSASGVRPRLTIRTGTRTVAAPTWMGYTIDDQDWADTTPWLGWVNVMHDPWIWVADLEKYIYLPTGQSGDTGAWSYVPDQQ